MPLGLAALADPTGAHSASFYLHPVVVTELWVPWTFMVLRMDYNMISGLQKRVTNPAWLSCSPLLMFRVCVCQRPGSRDIQNKTWCASWTWRDWSAQDEQIPSCPWGQFPGYLSLQKGSLGWTLSVILSEVKAWIQWLAKVFFRSMVWTQF